MGNELSASKETSIVNDTKIKSLGYVEYDMEDSLKSSAFELAVPYLITSHIPTVEALTNRLKEAPLDTLNQDHALYSVSKTAPATVNNNLRFLIVDDDPFNLLALESLMQMQGIKKIE